MDSATERWLTRCLQFHQVMVPVNLQVKATWATGMASRPLLLDQTQKRVAITVKVHGRQCLRVATGFAFYPKSVAAARPIGHLSCSQGFLYRGLVHPSMH